MTAIKYVSQKEMKERTGLGKALGYTFPEEDEILIRKGLTKKKKKEVLAHEEEHIEKGEEGPFWGTLIGAGLSLFGASRQSKAAKKAAKAQKKGFDQEIAFNRESRDLARGDQAPYVAAGHKALGALMDMTGLSAPRGAQAQRGEAGPGLAEGRREFDPENYLRGFGGRPRGRAYGGAMSGGQSYNINEAGPESVYANGSYTRSSQPRTIGGQDGYVHPEGRIFGGMMGPTAARRIGGSSGGFPRGRRGRGAVGPPGPAIPGPVTPGPINDQPPTQPTARDANGQPIENPGGAAGGYAFQTDPGYNFRFDEGQRVLERGAAAAGGLLSGGLGRRAIRYGQDYASNEYTNVYNRIANIAGLGQVSAGQSGQAAMYAGARMGGAAANSGMARGSGYTAQGNIWGNAAQGLGQLPWDDWFGGGGSNRSGNSSPT